MGRAKPLLRGFWRRHGRHLSPRLWPVALFVLAVPAYLRSLLTPSRNHICQEWSGTQDLDSACDVAVVVHFDRLGRVDRWLEHYLQQLKAAGFTVIFVSNAPRLDDQAVARIAPLCGTVLRRDNAGLDFGAYKDGLGRIPDLARVRRLILANDSAFGPFRPIGDIVRDMPADEAAVWGITDSVEGGSHLQSYFLLLHEQALRSDAFKRFWTGYRYVQSRYWNILMYEIGLSRAMTKAGLACRALCPYDDALSALSGAEVPHNPSHELWQVLIAEMGCPFIKRDLLRDVSLGDRSLENWREIVATATGYDTDLVEPQPRESRRAGAVSGA